MAIDTEDSSGLIAADAAAGSPGIGRGGPARVEWRRIDVETSTLLFFLFFLGGGFGRGGGPPQKRTGLQGDTPDQSQPGVMNPGWH